MTQKSTIPKEVWREAEILWDYHNMRHQVRPCDVGIGLGSHDIGVADYTAELFQQGMFPLIVFTGANAPTTIDLFPQGEAAHYRDRAISLGVPSDRIFVEAEARNTGENIDLSMRLLAEKGKHPSSVMLISRPYQQRRAYATCKKLWSEVSIVCASQDLPLDKYVEGIGSSKRVLDMLVGDTQRIHVYARAGFAVAQEMPEEVEQAFHHLVAAGYTSRLIGTPTRFFQDLTNSHATDTPR
ncbi:YdcF family protein [Sphaerisporangium rhizosphaerae]|uniref:YdcF family protein n=1 Tax=Sphaerisporangium rhizosphaerae TaxID=2269375 RepID=A0ABW2NXR5_9ACTN